MPFFFVETVFKLSKEDVCDKISIPVDLYSAFRQKFPKLWTNVAHSFLQQIAQNKNWAHPKANTLPRIYKVEMEPVSLLFYLAKPQSGGILGCDLRHCTSEPFDSRRFVEACRAYFAYSQYPTWSRCRRSADVPRAAANLASSQALPVLKVALDDECSSSIATCRVGSISRGKGLVRGYR